MTRFDVHWLQLRPAMTAVKDLPSPSMAALTAVKHGGMRVPQLQLLLTSKNLPWGYGVP